MAIRARKLAATVPHRFGTGGALRCRRCGAVLYDGEQPREGLFFCGEACWDFYVIEAWDEDPREPRWTWRYEVLMPEAWVTPGSRHRPPMVAVMQTNDGERAMVEARCRAYGSSRPVLVEMWDRAGTPPEGGYKGRRKEQRGLLVWDEVRS